MKRTEFVKTAWIYFLLINHQPSALKWSRLVLHFHEEVYLFYQHHEIAAHFLCFFDSEIKSKTEKVLSLNFARAEFFEDEYQI